MMFDQIVGFGDSWMWGDELLDPSLHAHPQAHPMLTENTFYRENHCFLGLLGKHYGVPTENFGWPGGSQRSSIWCYLWWLNNRKPSKHTLVLVGHTDANRNSFYNPKHHVYPNDPPWHRFVNSSWVHSGNASIESEWINMVKTHMTLTECHELSCLTYQETVLFFQGQNSKSGLTVLQFHVSPPPMLLTESTLLWPNSWIGKLLQELPDSKLMFSPNGHPNEKGHEIVRDHLIKEIDCAILA